VIAIALALALAPTVVVPDARSWSVEQRIAYLAESQARFSHPLELSIYGDAEMRAEIRRVGFARGCEILHRAGRETALRYAPLLKPYYEAAIRHRIPAQIIGEARIVSFLATPFTIYQRRVAEDAEQSGAALFAQARSELRSTILTQTGPLPTEADPAANVVMPRPDMAAALDLKGAWDLDNPAQMAMACSEQVIPPHMRPQITTGAR
jgi:hypothetical protein